MSDTITKIIRTAAQLDRLGLESSATCLDAVLASGKIPSRQVLANAFADALEAASPGISKTLDQDGFQALQQMFNQGQGAQAVQLAKQTGGNKAMLQQGLQSIGQGLKGGVVDGTAAARAQMQHGVQSVQNAGAAALQQGKQGLQAGGKFLKDNAKPIGAVGGAAALTGMGYLAGEHANPGAPAGASTVPGTAPTTLPGAATPATGGAAPAHNFGTTTNTSDPTYWLGIGTTLLQQTRDYAGSWNRVSADMARLGKTPQDIARVKTLFDTYFSKQQAVQGMSNSPAAQPQAAPAPNFGSAGIGSPGAAGTPGSSIGAMPTLQ